MRRLYLQVYLTVIATLVVLVLLAGTMWRFAFDASRFDGTFEVAGELAGAILPPAAAPPKRQQEALEALRQRLGADLALYDAAGTPIAAAGRPLPAPARDRAGSGWLRGAGGSAWALHLADGRWLVLRLARDQRRPSWWIAAFLALIALAVAVCAYPVVRRIARRIERLKAGVEQLGEGDLGARVTIEGKDEVAALARSFNRAAGRIQELVASHKALLANCSHELRTPLARIRMGIELARGGDDPQRRGDLLKDIAELDALIDEILLASRLDAQKVPERAEAVDLLALAAEEAARFDLAAGGTPVVVRGDPALLRRMIRNLLENARRHGGGGPIDVTVGAGDGGRAVLEISDGGPGVPEAEREKIFAPFYRLTESGATGGSGLGLALVRQIARGHGGEVRCLAGRGTGSVFRVTLPAFPRADPV